MKAELIRTVLLRPYRRGMGPSFVLKVWDTREAFDGGPWIGGRARLSYRLTMHEPGKPVVVLFKGSDFGASPMHAIDSNATVAALLGFLTLRPGDTDADYFAGYTPEQKAFCDSHAEALSVEAYARFEEE